LAFATSIIFLGHSKNGLIEIFTKITAEKNFFDSSRWI